MTAGEVEAGGVRAGAQVVGIGDEIVTLRNDRRLITSGDGWVRNGDRWQVLARGDNGALTVAELAGRGRTSLPAHYVADHVALAYAVTIHKAQGVTVDHAVLLVDDRTTAEGLYVGLTRGRRSNTALAVCADFDLEHRPAGEPPTPIEVVTAAPTGWLDTHADTLSYRHQLAGAVADRRHELGSVAAVTRSEHLVELIGPPPTAHRPPPTADAVVMHRWTSLARGIEAGARDRDRDRPVAVRGPGANRWIRAVGRASGL